MTGRRRTTQWAVLLAASAAVAACVSDSHTLDYAPPSITELDSHVSGMATAHCLTSLGDKGLPERDAQVMREQGDRWGQIVLERSAGDFFLAFAKMRPALDAALAATPMTLVKDEANAGSLTAPVYYCAQILRQPAVVSALAEARAILAPDYASR